MVLKRPQPRWKRLAAITAGGALLLLIIIADRSGWLLARTTNDGMDFHGQAARIASVQSANLLIADRPDPLAESDQTIIRLWGVRPDPMINKRAVGWLDSMVRGRTVLIRLEPHPTRDPVGRLLAHIDLETGENLNARLLERGFARLDDERQHSFTREYERRERHARRQRLGLWAQRRP